MKLKTAAFAVALSAGVGLAVQDFGVPPGVPNVFSSGEVAVAEEVNENFDWVEDGLAQLEITDNIHDLQIVDLEADVLELEDADFDFGLLIEDIETALSQLGLTDNIHDLRIGDLETDVAQLNSQVNSHDALINALAAAAKQRSQSFAALGYLAYGDCSGGLFQGENDELGGCPGWIGWMDLPAPSDWDTLTDMTVTFTLMNYVDDSQSAQDVDIDVYGDLIGSGDLAFGEFCFPGPDTAYDFYAVASVSVPAVQPPPLLGGGPSIPGGDAYLVSASFTISSGLLSGGPNPFSDPKHIRVNFFEPSGPIFGGPGGGGGGGTDPCLFFASHQGLDPFHHELFVTIEYTAL